MISLSLLACLSLGLFAPAAPASNSAPVSVLAPLAPEAAQGYDLQAEVDRALRWMRSQQDLESGSYGGVHETLQALQALATSHRAYRLADGPYISKAFDFLLKAQATDGGFGAATLGAELRLRDTRTAVQLLELFGAHPERLQRALAFLGEAGRGPLDPIAAKWNAQADGATKSAAMQARVGALLDARNSEGHWEGANGALLASSTSLLELNALDKLLAASKAQGAESAPKSAEALPRFEASLDPESLARAQKSMIRGAEFLLQESIASGRWGFQGQADPGITAMAATALLGLATPRPDHVQAAIDSATAWLVSLQHADGSIHAGQLPNYVTSASIMALVRADAEAHRDAIAKARQFLVQLQADEGEGYSPSDRFYGGVGYGGDERPDLSNMNMALEALSDAGLQAGDETFQKALSFLQRCQNRSESNDVNVTLDGKTFVSGNDGGSAYAPGDSKAGYITLRDGRQVPRSYGSMTYALLKGYLFAGLPKSDERVEAAWNWLSTHYTLDINPGFEGSSDPTAGYQGLFYYFTTMSKALDLYDQALVTDSAGHEHDWRAELLGRMLSLQRQDGSWINSNAPRWFEGNPVLASSYALITLANTLPGK